MPFLSWCCVVLSCAMLCSALLCFVVLCCVPSWLAFARICNAFCGAALPFKENEHPVTVIGLKGGPQRKLPRRSVLPSVRVTRLGQAAEAVISGPCNVVHNPPSNTHPSLPLTQNFFGGWGGVGWGSIACPSHSLISRQMSGGDPVCDTNSKTHILAVTPTHGIPVSIDVPTIAAIVAFVWLGATVLLCKGPFRRIADGLGMDLEPMAVHMSEGVCYVIFVVLGWLVVPFTECFWDGAACFCPTAVQVRRTGLLRARGLWHRAGDIRARPGAGAPIEPACPPPCSRRHVPNGRMHGLPWSTQAPSGRMGRQTHKGHDAVNVLCAAHAGDWLARGPENPAGPSARCRPPMMHRHESRADDYVKRGLQVLFGGSVCCSSQSALSRH